MKNGISGALLPITFPFAAEINSVGSRYDTWPCLLGAISYVETLCFLSPEKARQVISYDGGHGLFQLTSSYPNDWEDPTANATYAFVHFIDPAQEYWVQALFNGPALVRCIAAEYNAGRANAMAGHARGDVGLYTTKGSDGTSYSDRVLAAYTTLSEGSLPPLP